MKVVVSGTRRLETKVKIGQMTTSIMLAKLIGRCHLSSSLKTLMMLAMAISDLDVSPCAWKGLGLLNLALHF